MNKTQWRIVSRPHRMIDLFGTMEAGGPGSIPGWQPLFFFLSYRTVANNLKITPPQVRFIKEE
jgi:hypothetical protein